MTYLHALIAWCAHNPVVALTLASVVLSGVYSMLPPRLARSPAGRLLGRVSTLTHRLSEGTLKLPLARPPHVPHVEQRDSVPPRETIAPPEHAP